MSSPIIDLYPMLSGCISQCTRLVLSLAVSYHILALPSLPQSMPYLPACVSAPVSVKWQRLDKYFWNKKDRNERFKNNKKGIKIYFLKWFVHLSLSLSFLIDWSKMRILFVIGLLHSHTHRDTYRKDGGSVLLRRGEGWECVGSSRLIATSYRSLGFSFLFLCFQSVCVAYIFLPFQTFFKLLFFFLLLLFWSIPSVSLEILERSLETKRKKKNIFSSLSISLFLSLFLFWKISLTIACELAKCVLGGGYVLYVFWFIFFIYYIFFFSLSLYLEYFYLIFFSLSLIFISNFWSTFSSLGVSHLSSLWCFPSDICLNIFSFGEFLFFLSYSDHSTHIGLFFFFAWLSPSQSNTYQHIVSFLIRESLLCTACGMLCASQSISSQSLVVQLHISLSATDIIFFLSRIEDHIYSMSR